MKKLTLPFLSCLLCFCSMFSSCEVKDNTPCTARHTYHPLTDEEKSKTPYFNNPDFDTLRFLSNAGDTLTFALQSTDSSWYIEDANRNPNPDGCPDWQYYETKTIKYKELKSSNLFIGILAKRNQIYPHSSLTILMNGYSFLYGVDVIGASDYIYYVGDMNIIDNFYQNVLYEFNNNKADIDIKGYLNNEQGFVGIKDKQANIDFAFIP